MKYRTLGRTGTQVSELCLGCMNFGGRTDKAESIPIIHRATVPYYEADFGPHSHRW